MVRHSERPHGIHNVRTHRKHPQSDIASAVVSAPVVGEQACALWDILLEFRLWELVWFVVCGRFWRLQRRRRRRIRSPPNREQRERWRELGPKRTDEVRVVPWAQHDTTAANKRTRCF